MADIVWKPQPRQAAFMRRNEKEALYGGAAGGGKSDALVMEALRQVHIPHYRALILRKTFPQLRDLIDKTRRYYPAAYPTARYNGTSHTWVFPSGAQIIFGSLQHSADKYNYQGQAYDLICFDELTQFAYDEYMYLISRNRPKSRLLCARVGKHGTDVCARRAVYPIRRAVRERDTYCPRPIFTTVPMVCCGHGILCHREQ